MKTRFLITRTVLTRGGTVLAVVLGMMTALPVLAEPPAKTRSPATPDAAKDVQAGSPSVRRARLARYLTGATFEGGFSVDGRENATLTTESYTITSCEPLAEEDRYRMKVKIRYGDVDGEFPMDLDILWAGLTPVITLDSMAIPGLGTFSARVLIRNGRYAGTWQHGSKGGHLYGKITPAEK